MSWDAKDVALLKELWAAGYSAGQIASRLGHSRNAVSAKLKRLGHKRGHKPPTANPKIVAVPGLVPEDVFFEHLANRRFPVTWWTMGISPP